MIHCIHFYKHLPEQIKSHPFQPGSLDIPNDIVIRTGELVHFKFELDTMPPLVCQVHMVAACGGIDAQFPHNAIELRYVDTVTRCCNQDALKHISHFLTVAESGHIDYDDQREPQYDPNERVENYTEDEPEVEAPTMLSINCARCGNHAQGNVDFTKLQNHGFVRIEPCPNCSVERDHWETAAISQPKPMDIDSVVDRVSEQLPEIKRSVIRDLMAPAVDEMNRMWDNFWSGSLEEAAKPLDEENLPEAMEAIQTFKADGPLNIVLPATREYPQVYEIKNLTEREIHVQLPPIRIMPRVTRLTEPNRV